MPDISTIIQTGAAQSWFYLPVALLLGALHALEPGHSKSMIAAFIVAVRGTTAQAVILGVSAAIGHSIVVWALALIGLSLGDKLIVEHAEPWLVLASGVLIVLLGLNLIRASQRGAQGHSHDHRHHGGHSHEHGHGHGHRHRHGEDIKAIATKGGVATSTIVWFGFTGGLLPCPAAIAVLLVCLQIKAFALGIAMVAAFSAGLAATLVAVGVTASWGAGKAARWAGFERHAAKLPIISGLIVILAGVAVTIRGLALAGYI